MTATKPTITPTMASAGKVTWMLPSGRVVAAVVLIHPTVAAASRRTKSAAVLEIVPLTVMTPERHGLTGPSLIGAVVGVPSGGAQTVPPGLGAFGAAQPDCASSSVLSLRIGLGTGGLPS